MKCRFCGCYQKPKLDVRSLFTAIALTALIFFIGGLFFYHELLIPRYDQKIEKDKEIKKELQKGYLPPKVDPKGKQETIK